MIVNILLDVVLLLAAAKFAEQVLGRIGLHPAVAAEAERIRVEALIGEVVEKVLGPAPGAVPQAVDE